jgi:hypothetical protein
MASESDEQEVVLQIPDMGLSDGEIERLKETFRNGLVTTLGAKTAATRIVVVRIRVVRQL